MSERARYLRQTADLYDTEAATIARILTTEMGKTFASAKGEVAKCAMALRWFAEHAEALLADEVIDRRPDSLRPLPAARPGAGRHALELPPLAGDPLRRPRPHGRQRRPAEARVERPADGAAPGGPLPARRATPKGSSPTC